MKKVFISTAGLDKRATSFGLSELILQENAAAAVARCVKKHFKGRKIIGFCGGGNNGADALATLRMLNGKLSGEYECVAVLTSPKLNKNAQIQALIAKEAGVRIVCLSPEQILEFSQILEFKDITSFDKSQILEFSGDLCVIDGIFGSGLSRTLSGEISGLINELNMLSALKIAVDIPSGLDMRGVPLGTAFEADFTITMGALKLGLFSDFAKDYVGKVKVADLGLCSSVFCGDEKSDFLLESSDLALPKRTKQNVNKGSFGHAFIALGAMSGAAMICAKAALNMGAGKVSIAKGVRKNENLAKSQILEFKNLEFSQNSSQILDYEIMLKTSFDGASAIGFGMGLGGAELDFEGIKRQNCPLLIDADMFYKEQILEFLGLENVVLTPHPKEFASLLKLAKIGDFSLNEVLENKMSLAREFSQKFASCLVLKGANTAVAQNGTLFICDIGTNALAKGGSGDALSGIILALLAQGYSAKSASISGVLAHAKIARNYRKNAFSLTPKDIIKGIKCL